MQPELSVVIPTHNRRELIRASLESLSKQTVPVERFEVVVVVDGSTDGTAEMLADLVMPFRLSVVSQPAAGASSARNAGVARATGRILLFIDDDEQASPALVAEHLRVHEGNEKIAGVGLIERTTAPNADRFARFRAESAAAYTRKRATASVSYLDFYGGNCSVSRATFDEVGGFAAGLARENDFEFAYRLQRAGADFRFLPDAVTWEYRTYDWRAIVADMKLRGGIALELYRRHPPMIEKMEIGGHGPWPRRLVAFRDLGLGLRIRPELVARVGLALPRDKWARQYLRFADGYAYWWGVRAACDRDLWRSLKRGVLILTYHAFGDDGEPGSRYVVPRRRLARQLAMLRLLRYNVISLDEYVSYRRAHRFPPPRSAVITIDDGYVDADTVARPLLERFGWPATVFLLTSPDRLNPGATEASLAGRPLLELARARELVGGVIHFGGHTRTHPELPQLDPAAVELEVRGCKEELESALSTSVENFAYPFGEVNEEVRKAVEKAGFWSACGVTPGSNRPATDSFNLRRIDVRGTDTTLAFLRLLALGDAGPRRPRPASYTS